MPLKRLLIVDDDPATLDGLVEVFEAAGFTCTGVRTFHEALCRLRDSPPDLLITDIRLGAYNGLQLVMSRPPHVPALVITAFPDKVLEAEAIRSGAAYLEKPVNRDRLVTVVRRLLFPDRPDTADDGSASDT